MCSIFKLSTGCDEPTVDNPPADVDISTLKADPNFTKNIALSFVGREESMSLWIQDGINLAPVSNVATISLSKTDAASNHDALNDLLTEAAGKFTTYILPGAYPIGGSLSIPSNSRIEGFGMGRGLSSGIETPDCTALLFDNTDGLTISNESNIAIENLRISSLSGSYNTTGAGLKFTGLCSEFISKNILMDYVHQGLVFDGLASPVNHQYTNWRLQYTDGIPTEFIDGCEINSMQFSKCRWEANDHDVPLIKSTGNAKSVNNIEFESCVSESSSGQYAMDMGNNITCSLTNHHFESNGRKNLDNSGDIFIGAGTGSVTIQGGIFSNPAKNVQDGTNKGFHNIVISNDSTEQVSIKGAKVQYGGVGYEGLIKNKRQPGVSAERLSYIGKPPIGFDWFKDCDHPQIIHDYPGSVLKSSMVVDGLTKRLRTTDSIPSIIWKLQYINTRVLTWGSISMEADISGISTDGKVVCSFSLRELFLIDKVGAAIPVSIGSANNTAIKSIEANATNAEIIATPNFGKDIEILVTGVKAKTIDWIVSVKYIFATN